jgi:hypothetical protein
MLMLPSQIDNISRRRFLRGAAAGAVATAGMSLPARRGWAAAPTVHQAGNLEAIVVSDGHFALPTVFLVTPDAPPAEREAALKAAGQSVRPRSRRPSHAGD